jgi:tripeptidyl-peptidase-2
LANGIPFSPTRIRRALMATASVLPGLSILQQGAGMIQVSRAWEYLQQFKDLETADVHLDVTIDNLSGSPRGVYLRQAPETCVPQTMAVRVDPTWRREDATTAKSQQCKIAFEAKFLLQSTVDWVKAPAHFMIMNNGRTFKMDVDPSGLKPGLHTAQVLGVDASCPEAGPLFAVPITVAKPLPESRSIDFGELSFGPAEMKRFFVVPPLGSTWMDIILTDTRSPDEEAFLKLYSLHTVQLLPHAAYRDFEEAKYYNLRPGQTVVATVAVEAGVTSEIDVGRYWSTLGPAAVKAQVAFRGIRPIPNQIQMVCGDAGALVRVNSDLADESLNPAAKLTKWWAPLRPKEAPTVQPLGERDVLPSHNKQVYQLLLTYEFTQEDKGSFTPRVPTTQGVLYESGFESQMIMVYDGEKKLLGSADSWPSSISAPKGKVVLRMQIRHDSPEKLESLKDMPLWIERTLDKEISLSVYSSREAMVLGKATFRKRTLRRGCGAAVFFQEPAVSKLPSGYKTGDLLKGSYTLASGDASLVGDGKRPGGFPITYTVGPKPSKTSSDPDPPQPKDERTVEEKLSEAIRDLKVARLDELTSKEKEDGKFDILFGEFVKDYPKHLPLLMAKLRYLDTHAKRADKLTEILAAAEAVLVEISEDSLSLYFGKKADPNDADANKLKTEMKERKSFFVEALARSAMTYTQLTTADDAAAKFDAAFKRLQAWVDLDSDKQYTALYLEREKRAGRYGTVVKVLNKLLGKEVKEKDFMYPVTKAQLLEERTAALTKLGYTTLVDRDQKTRGVACPKSYALF